MLYVTYNISVEPEPAWTGPGPHPLCSAWPKVLMHEAASLRQLITPEGRSGGVSLVQVQQGPSHQAAR